jgi:hypothetical protein
MVQNNVLALPHPAAFASDGEYRGFTSSLPVRSMFYPL